MRILILDSSKQQTSKYGKLRIDEIFKNHSRNIIGIITSNENSDGRTNKGVNNFVKKIKKKKSLIFLDLTLKFLGFIKNKKINWLYTESAQNIDFKAYNVPILFVKKINSEETRSIINDLECDLIYHTGGLILKESILSAPKLGVIGYHHGDIEKYRGPLPGFWELYNKENKIGVTIQFLRASLDTGPIVLKKEFEIPEKIKLKKLQELIFWQSYDMASKAITKIINNETHKSEYCLGAYNSYPNFFQILKLMASGKII